MAGKEESKRRKKKEKRRMTNEVRQRLENEEKI